MELPCRQYQPLVSEYLRSLKESSKFGPQVVCHKIFEETEPIFFQENGLLSSPLAAALRKSGINTLYCHQGEAFAQIAGGANIIVSTPTSSGKSMVYNLPVFEKILAERNSHALYLFPLKALSQDQLRTLNKLYDDMPGLHGRYDLGPAAIYDGDTSPYRRRKIREHTPPILIANPEMLHLSFLPYHENWVHFFKNLDYVIIDEVHTYRGVFGSHVAWLIRRLKRILDYYGKKTQFILSSATIGNPKEFGERLIGEKVKVITRTGAPLSKKNFLFLNPWDSPAYTASQLLEASLKRGLRTIVYTQSRKMTELITLWTQPRLGALADKVSSYRAGFLAEERREIEQKLADGSLLGVISTSALELGIDIGDLDICILVGYPGSIMASWQRGGRVGRSGRESAIIMLGSEDALDQYYMNNPQRFFSKDVESAVLNPGNIKILKEHLICAAAEIPLHKSDSILGSEAVRKGAEELRAEAKLLLSADGLEYYAARKRPQRNVNLRGTGNALTIINGETGVIMGEVDAARALKECHEGAIYLHRVKTWFVEKLDLQAAEIVVTEKKRATFYTRAMATKDTEILTVTATRNIYGCRLSHGNLKVSEHVTGYQKRNNGTNKLITTLPLELPVQTMETEGFWLDIPAPIVTLMEDKKLHFMGGLHAFEHVMISIFPLLVLCDRNDVGGISCPHHEQTEGATIFIYDGHAGGSGLSAEAYRKAEELIERALEIVKTCDCDNGCPSCVHSPKCGSGNRPIDKNACLNLIEGVMVSSSEEIPPMAVVNRESPQTKDYIPRPAPGGEIAYYQNGLEALPEHYGVFDLETKFSADEVGGWHRAEKMGISVGVVYDSVLDGCVTYLEHETAQLVAHLQSLDLVVGFNNKQFDNRVLASYTTVDLTGLPTLDLLEEVKNHLGYRLSLNGIAEHTLSIKKSGDGLMALQWYREKNFEMLSKYCKKDVEITRDLLIFGLENGFFLFRNKAGKTVRLPLSLAKTIAAQCAPKEPTGNSAVDVGGIQYFRPG
ncbi:DEAD/DEAH box helicase [Desulfopila inferna]|uniref:DEAD/DEAH box helicase n=1 Tax=Desulfopila inferna TaxID=468528 RepID=UPI001965987C|nr:DEAD/DEAH box helicase [Desulfopila inferna]MBM9602875.1 DEAD/DEAH box helicase [Desulfopila inferna]